LDVLQKERYAWWIRRMEHNLRLFDIIRVDHFRGRIGKIYEWRLLPEQLRLDPWLREMAEIYHRG